MAYTPYVGYQQTVTWNSVALDGLMAAELSEEAGPAVAQIDVTTCANTTYTEIADPWGSKGSPAVKFTVTLQDSTASYADNKQTKFAFNSKQALVWATEPATATANQYDHAALELTARTTEITWTEPYATCRLEFEGTALGAWTSPA